MVVTAKLLYASSFLTETEFKTTKNRQMARAQRLKVIRAYSTVSDDAALILVKAKDRPTGEMANQRAKKEGHHRPVAGEMGNLHLSASPKLPEGNAQFLKYLQLVYNIDRPAEGGSLASVMKKVSGTIILQSLGLL